VSQKGYNFLGLAQRAGSIKSGDAAAEAIIKKGKAKLVLLAKDASDKTKAHFINLAKFKNVRWIEGGDKLHLGVALGKSPRSVIIITDDNFAGKIQELFGEEEQDF